MPTTPTIPSLRAILQRVRFLMLRDRLSAELEEEMRFHVEQRAARLRAEGAAPDDAERAALRRFGNRAAIEERSRDAWGGAWLEHAAADVRFALRRMRRRPAFAVAVMIVAALGIGASTAVFSAIDAALLRPLPFVRPSELVMLPSVDVPFSQQLAPAGQLHFLDFTDASRFHDLFSSVAAYASGGLNLADARRPRRVRVGVVTTGFFATLGARAERGRVFSDAEGRPGGAHPVVLSDALWRTTFGGAAILGRSVDLSGTRYTIVGIMEPGFNFPNTSDLWIPLTVPLSMETFAAFRGYLPSHVVARLAPGIPAAVASTRMLQRWHQLAGPGAATQRPYFGELFHELRAGGAAVPLRQVLVGDTRRPLLILLGATVLLLLVACTNVATLLLSDGALRGREVALRGVLGASHSRILRQLLVESACLAGAGGVVGVALAPALLGLVRAMLPQNLAGIEAASIDVRVLAFAATLALATGVAFGLWPALSSARREPGDVIKLGATGGATARRASTARRVLITTELALSVMLLVGAGLMMRSLSAVMAQPSGIDPEHVGTVELTFASGMPASRRVARVEAILRRLEGDPAIQAVGAINDVPLSGEGAIGLQVAADGEPEPKSTTDISYARYLIATRGYFAAMGIVMDRGHTFGDGLDSLSPKVAVINEAMARQHWPHGNPLGRTFHTAQTEHYTVVGVIADVRERSLADTATPQMYFPFAQMPSDHIALVARSALPTPVLLARMSDAVRSVDPTQAVFNARAMNAIVSTSVAPRRTNTVLIALFGAVALLLSAFGVYAVVSQTVTQRARELGIRCALGATGLRLATLVGREMAVLLGLGTALGLGGAWMLARALASLLFGVTTHDPSTFIAAPLVLVLSVAVAAAIPARRAMHANPVDVIRSD